MTPHKPQATTRHHNHPQGAAGYWSQHGKPQTPTTRPDTLAELTKRNTARSATRERLAILLGNWNPTSAVAWRYEQADLLEREIEAGRLPHTHWII